MGQGNEIGRIGRREGPIDFRHEPGGEVGIDGPRVPEGNTGIVGPTANEAPVEVPRDGFITDPGLSQGPSLLKGEGNQPVLQSVNSLVPDLNHLNELGQIPLRFATDAALLRSQLAAPGIPADEQLDRTFRFFLAYAERFVEIARPLEAKAELAHQGDPNGQAQGQLPGEKKKGEKQPPVGPDGKPLPEGEGGVIPGDGRVLQGEKLPAPPLPRHDEPSYPGVGGMMEVIEHDEPQHLPVKQYTPAQVEENVRDFARALQDAGFTQMKDLRTGKDGVALAEELLSAKSPKELEQKAKEIALGYEPPPPPPEEAQTPRERMQQAITRDIPLEPVRDLASDAARGIDPRRAELGSSTARAVQPRIDGAFVLAPSQMPTRELEATDARSERAGYSNKRLGSRMLWNVLHTFRRSGGDTAVEEAKWDRITFGAILFLAGAMVGAIILVSLYI